MAASRNRWESPTNGELCFNLRGPFGIISAFSPKNATLKTDSHICEPMRRSLVLTGLAREGLRLLLPEPPSKSGWMKVSKGHSQPEIGAAAFWIRGISIFFD